MTLCILKKTPHLKTLEICMYIMFILSHVTLNFTLVMIGSVLEQFELIVNCSSDQVDFASKNLGKFSIKDIRSTDMRYLRLMLRLVELNLKAKRV